MPIQRFPNPEEADAEGLVALGGDLHPDSLLLAYRQGIFPWPSPGLPTPWFCPDPRAILRFRDLRPGRSLERAIRKAGDFRFTLDQAFSAVIRKCRKAQRKDQEGTWITPQMVEAYERLHELGYAHSAEVWMDGVLTGGLYGVSVDGAFAGESMFHERDNASKIALVKLAEHLASQGLEWMDIQMLTPHLERLGAIEVPRREFLDLLKKTRARKRTLSWAWAGPDRK